MRLNSVGKVTTGFVTSVTGNPLTNRATATYVLTTNDGANMVVSEQATIPYVEAFFEAGNGEYGYLNNVTAWATGSEDNNVISLCFWQVRLLLSVRLALKDWAYDYSSCRHLLHNRATTRGMNLFGHCVQRNRIHRVLRR